MPRQISHASTLELGVEIAEESRIHAIKPIWDAVKKLITSADWRRVDALAPFVELRGQGSGV